MRSRTSFQAVNWLFFVRIFLYHWFFAPNCQQLKSNKNLNPFEFFIIFDYLFLMQRFTSASFQQKLRQLFRLFYSIFLVAIQNKLSWFGI